jgi:hypothetical protein
MSRGPSWDSQPGFYFNIDENDLVKKLIDVRENWQQKREQVAHHAHAFRRRFSWPNVLQPFVEALKQLIG